VYAVAQFYFILQVPITRLDLSILVNATVFAVGIFTMMFLIRRHLVSVELNAFKAQITNPTPTMPSTQSQKPHGSLFRLPWKKTPKQQESQTEENREQAEAPERGSDHDQAAEQSDETSANPSDAATKAGEPDTEPDDMNAEPRETVEEPLGWPSQSDEQDY
ncbi:MAG TPA: hypothetical protein VFE96_05240, partial [Candidatus Bathyarchaeia archaeon]|nr:hypothetical protein [Candidatus Bathyarchaeia archaeon]